MATCDVCANAVTPFRYYCFLIAGIVICASSLTGKLAPWGYIGEADGTNTNRPTTWLNPLSVQYCQKDDPNLLYNAILSSTTGTATTSSLAPSQYRIDVCYEWPFEIIRDPQCSIGFCKQKDLQECAGWGLTSFILMIVGLGFALGSFILIKCLFDKAPIVVQYVFIFISFSNLLLSVVFFHQLCTLGTNTKPPSGYIQTIAYGFLFACLGVAVLFIWLFMQILALQYGTDIIGLDSRSGGGKTTTTQSNFGGRGSSANYDDDAPDHWKTEVERDTRNASVGNKAGTFTDVEKVDPFPAASEDTGGAFGGGGFGDDNSGFGNNAFASEPAPTQPEPKPEPVQPAPAQENPFELMSGGGKKKEDPFADSAFNSGGDPFAPAGGAW